MSQHIAAHKLGQITTQSIASTNPANVVHLSKRKSQRSLGRLKNDSILQRCRVDEKLRSKTKERIKEEQSESPGEESEKEDLVETEPSCDKPTIEDFEVKKLIGIGNFGKVVKAYNKKSAQDVALKILDKESVAQMKHVEHIISEHNVLSFLSLKNTVSKQVKQRECPFTINLFSAFQDSQNFYFEMEYVKGCTLMSQIKVNPTIQNHMDFYAAEVIRALEYLHSYNIIYRDLKPENVLIDQSLKGHLRLVDFGFSKQLKSSKEKTQTNCGTPAYVAPEIIRGQNSHGKEVDIWSLGVLMVELVSGQTPFKASSTKEIYENISKCKPTYNKLVTKTLRNLLDEIFVSDPDQRLTLAEIKRNKIFKVSPAW